MVLRIVLMNKMAATPHSREADENGSYRYYKPRQLYSSTMTREFFLHLLILILFQMLTIINCSYETQSKQQPIKAAIKTTHTIGFHNVKLSPQSDYSPNLIEVKSSVPLVTIKFNSASSKMNLLHQHDPPPNPPETKESFSEDEPHILRHQVVKPIVQEVHEIISPIRKIVQEVKPVQEDINTIVSRSSGLGGSLGLSPDALAEIFQSTARTSSPMIAPSTQPTSMPLINQAITIDHTQPSPRALGIDSVNIQNVLIDDLATVLAHKQPDLLIRTENELYDNSLYDGSNEYDLKHPAYNSEGLSQPGGHDYPLYMD